MKRIMPSLSLRAALSARTSGRSPLRRLAGALAVTALAVPLALAGTAGPASAAEHRPAPADHWAGSTIAAHEDVSRMPSGPVGAGLAANPEGIDVSHYQGTINWGSVAGAGIKFAYIKATEGTTYTDPTFSTNYLGSYNAGLIRGAYHFARPNTSTGAAQAGFLAAHGGKWSADGQTLPPMLDMEYGPAGSTCYGLSQSAMVNWIKDFSSTTKQLTGRYPAIYTTTDWWTQCTGNSAAFNQTNALVLARYNTTPGNLPAWPSWTIWQYSSTGRVAGISGNVDRDVFNGALTRLQAFAKCNEENPC